MLYSASWNESFVRSGGSTESMYLKAHLMRVLIGFVFMFIFLILDYLSLKIIAHNLIIISFILIIVTKSY